MNTNSVTFFNRNKIKAFPKGVQLILAVWKIVNPGNMGHIIRLAHNVGAMKVLFISENKDFRESKIQKTAGFSFDQMEWEIITKHKFSEIIQTNFNLVVLETCDEAKNIFETDLPAKLIILAGNESYGLPKEIIERSDLQVFIPMHGECKSMNVSHALSVAAFEWY